MDKTLHEVEGRGRSPQRLAPNIAGNRCTSPGPVFATGSAHGVSILHRDTTWRVHEAAQTSLLVDGRDYYRAFHAAAMTATRSILLLGWQFDSDVQLLRGEDVPHGARPTDFQLLSLLDHLCRERPELQTRVLAWDHSVFFALEREILQKLYFDAITCERFAFRWDSTVPFGGSHHQKVAIIDGRIAFFGSQDIAQARWDDSQHLPTNTLRFSRDQHHQPYHEVQIAVRGEAARSMVDLFARRWHGATGEELDVDALVSSGEPPDVPVTLPMPAARLGLARTIPEVEGRAPVREVSALYAATIIRAEHLIYIESQYLTACVVRDALIDRMRDATRPKLDLVLVLPQKPEKFKEEMAVGVPQALLLRALDEEARRHGHAFSVFNVQAGTDATGRPVHVYIHAKLMIVDDRWFVVGSANLTNRSMTIDSEICAVYDAEKDLRVSRAIRRARVRLLTEHLGGVANLAMLRTLVQPEGLAGRLEGLAETGNVRLRKHHPEAIEPSLLAKTVHGLTAELLDPWDHFERTCASPPSESPFAPVSEVL